MQDGQNYFSEFLTAIITASTVWIGRWIFERRKDQNDADKSEVELSEQVATLWRETSKELRTEVKELRSEMEGMRDEMSKLRAENKGLKTENARLRKQVEGLTKRQEDFEIKHGE